MSDNYEKWLNIEISPKKRCICMTVWELSTVFIISQRAYRSYFITIKKSWVVSCVCVHAKGTVWWPFKLKKRWPCAMSWAAMGCLYRNATHRNVQTMSCASSRAWADAHGSTARLLEKRVPSRSLKHSPAVQNVRRTPTSPIAPHARCWLSEVRAEIGRLVLVTSPAMAQGWAEGDVGVCV